MTNVEDMSSPVTRGELREELVRFEPRFEAIDQRFEQVDRRFEQVDRRFEQVDRRFEQVDQRFEQVDQRFEQVDQRFEQVERRLEHISGELSEVRSTMATKHDLEIWGGALLDRFTQEMRAMEKRLQEDLARHSRANHEDTVKQIAAIDQKYADLPPRVSKLEGEVFPHRRRR
jgi:chromosome segregation ATPase